MKEPTINDAIAYLVREMAAQLFFECGAANDYCIQSIGTVAIVFGGTNRVILDEHGWHADRKYCTEKFLKLWDERFPQHVRTVHDLNCTSCPPAK